MKILIYGLFKKGTDQCLYVGRSKDLKSRINCHKSQKTVGTSCFDVRILGSSTNRMAAIKEGEFIQFYKSIGQAKINKRTNISAEICDGVKIDHRKIGIKIEIGESFRVKTNKQRKLVLLAASFAGKKVSSRKSKSGGFTIFFF